MEPIKTLVLTGYRSFELGIFQEKDPKITVIKKVIKTVIENYLENGLEWLLVGGNLGVECWGAEVAFQLRQDYPDFKIAVIFPFADFGSQWQEAKRLKLQEITRQADFVDSVSHQPYEAPQQLRNHTNFLLTHSGGALLVYDREFPGKAHFFLRDAQAYAEKQPYLIHEITMDDLQNAINE